MVDVWNQFRRRFENFCEYRWVMEQEIVNFWYLLQEDDFVQDLYIGMKTRLRMVITQGGSLY